MPPVEVLDTLATITPYNPHLRSLPPGDVEMIHRDRIPAQPAEHDDDLPRKRRGFVGVEDVGIHKVQERDEGAGFVGVEG